jgi:uncharacterized membrane protein
MATKNPRWNLERRRGKEKKIMEILLFLGVLVLALGLLDLVALKWGKISREADTIVDRELSTLLTYKS